LRLAVQAVVAPGQAAQLVRRVEELRAGKVGARLELTVARLGLAAAKLVRPAGE
jgi:hypothetical protein